MTNTGITNPYADGQRLYLEAGWPAPLPVVGKAGNLPSGVTGREGVDPTSEQLAYWADSRAGDNLCLRTPPGCVGLDVDAYKRGLETLQAAIAEWGQLPATWRSTARAASDKVSGIYWYQVEPGVELKDRVAFNGVSDLETIQSHHRFAVVWPSIHPDTGTRYEWIGPDGSSSIPTWHALPWLPDSWVEGLRAEAPLSTHPPVEVEAQEAPREFWDVLVLEQFEELRRAALGFAGSRHDNAREATMALARSERRGKQGASTALSEAVALWVELMGGEREYGVAEREILDLISGGRKLAATTPTTAVEQESLEWMNTVNVPDYVDQSTGEIVRDPEPEEKKTLADQILSVDQIIERPPPVALVEGVLFRHSLAALSAPPKTGKTFVMLALAMSLVSGIPWYGCRIPKRGKVLYILGEGIAGASSRIKAWQAENPHADLSNLHFLDRAVVLRDPVDVMALIDWVAEQQYDAIIFDTLARAAVGLEENSAKEMGQVVAVLDRLKVVSDACIILVHHTGKDTSRGMRGSSALAGALDTSLYCEGDIRNLWIKTDFQKDADDSWDVQLAARHVGDSLVLEKRGPTFERSEFDEKVLQVLKWAGVPVSRSEWTNQCVENGLAKSSSYRAIGRLINDGAVDSPDGLETRGARFVAKE